MRGIADFDLDYQGSYFYFQACINSFYLLLEKVWPVTDSWYTIYLQLSNTSEKLEPNLAGNVFLELLLKLRTVFL